MPGSEEKFSQEEIYFPPLTGDTWERQEAEDLGWDIGALREAVEYAESRNSYSLLILHKGKIVSENYWKGSDVNSVHGLESAAKSIAAALVGKMQAETEFSLEESMTTYLGEGWSNAPAEKEKLITGSHLLSMTSGLDYRLDYLGDAGTRWYYSHAAYTALLAAFEPVTGQSHAGYSSEHLFDKIGMNKSYWEGFEMFGTARDMARFGLLMLADGKWGDTEIFGDKSYLREMHSPSQNFQEAYGYLWWLNGQATYFDDVRIKDGSIFPAMPEDGRLGMGYADQRLEVVPSLDLVVIRQGGMTGLPEIGESSFTNQFWTRLMRAVKPSLQ